jgi:hypothetical protein
MYRIGLKPRRGTRPARTLPPDFETVQRLFVMRIVYIVLTYNVMRTFFFDLWTKLAFGSCPLRSIWAEGGAAQVDISNLGDKRLFTGVPVVDACDSLVYTQLICRAKLTPAAPPHVCKTSSQTSSLTPGAIRTGVRQGRWSCSSTTCGTPTSRPRCWLCFWTSPAHAGSSHGMFTHLTGTRSCWLHCDASILCLSSSLFRRPARATCNLSMLVLISILNLSSPSWPAPGCRSWLRNN